MIHEWREEQEQLRLEMTRFDTSVQTGFNSLDAKMLQAEKRADELKNDHLSAVRHELELIDRQSFDELRKSLQDLAKDADGVFAKLESHWYTMGIGADGAKHALEVFKVQYDALSVKGDGAGAANLLAGTLDQAKKVEGAMRQVRAYYDNGQRDSERAQANANIAIIHN